MRRLEPKKSVREEPLHGYSISHTQHIKALVSDFGCILWFLDQLCWIPVNWAVSALGVPLCTACVLILPEVVD